MYLDLGVLYQLTTRELQRQPRNLRRPNGFRPNIQEFILDIFLVLNPSIPNLFQSTIAIEVLERRLGDIPRGILDTYRWRRRVRRV